MIEGFSSTQTMLIYLICATALFMVIGSVAFASSDWFLGGKRGSKPSEFDLMDKKARDAYHAWQKLKDGGGR